MPEYVDPFLANAAGRKMTRAELIRALRLSLAAEQEAIVLYTAHADAAGHPLAQKALLDGVRPIGESCPAYSPAWGHLRSKGVMAGPTRFSKSNWR